MFSTSVLSYHTFDSVSVFQENGEDKVYVRIKGYYLGSTLTRMDKEFVSSDTLTQISFYVKNCTGALADNYIVDTVLVLDSLVYPPEFNLRINLFYDTNTVFYDPPINCDIYYSPWLAVYYYMTISDIASTSEELLQKEFLIFPNPVSNEISIKTKANIINQDYYITDQLGKVVHSGRYKPKISVNHLSRGQYFFILRTEKYIYRRKFMVE